MTPPAEPSPPPYSARFARVPAIGAGADLHAEIDGWLGSEPLRELVQAFGGGPEVLADGALADRLDRLDTFSQRWDARQGRERNLAADLDLTAGQRELAISAGEALGLRGPETLRFDHYDHVLMLGGLIRACLARPATAALLLKPGTVPGRTITAGAITALGGHRPFAGDEFEQAALEGLAELTEEYQALDAGTRRAFGLGEPTSVEHHDSALPGGTWGIRTYEWRPPSLAAATEAEAEAAGAQDAQHASSAAASQPDQAAPEQATLEQAAPERASPARAMPQLAALEPAVPERAVPGPGVPDQAAPDQNAPEQVALRQAVPQRPTPDRAMPKQAASSQAVPIRVVAAPSSEPELRRANTPDSYAFFAARIADLAPGSRLLLISTAIHVLPQHLAALRMLGRPYRAEIDTVSARAGSVPGMPLANFTPTKYLQEIRSTIRILRQLAADL